MPEFPKSEYELMYSLEESFWWYVGMREITKAVFSRAGIKDGGILDILDVGCGTGYNLNFLSQFGESYGVEFSAQPLRLASQRNIKNAIQADALCLPFIDDSFDLACSFDVVECIPEEDQALAEIYRVLKNGGIFFMREIAYTWMKGDHDRINIIQRRYTASSMASSLKQAGFEIIFSTYANFFLFPVIAAIRLFKEHLLPPRKSPASDVHLSPGFINEPLKWILKIEANILRNINLPFGTSVIVMARKP